MEGGQRTTSGLIDRQERLMASLATRFKNLVSLAVKPIAEDATKELAASQSFQMEVESAAMVRSVEDLLQLTRELKELWLFGTLRDIGAEVEERNMDEDSARVGEMVEKMLSEQAGIVGGERV